MKNRFLIYFCFILLLSTPVFFGVEGGAFAANTTVQTQSKTVEKTASANSNKQAKDENAFFKKNAADFKQVESFSLKSGVFKFLMAMLGVLVSAFAIFLGLKLYKKLVLKGYSSSSTDFESSFESPKDLKEAINLFLHKTDK